MSTTRTGGLTGARAGVGDGHLSVGSLAVLRRAAAADRRVEGRLALWPVEGLGRGDERGEPEACGRDRQRARPVPWAGTDTTPSPTAPHYSYESCPPQHVSDLFYMHMQVCGPLSALLHCCVYPVQRGPHRASPVWLAEDLDLHGAGAWMFQVPASPERQPTPHPNPPEAWANTSPQCHYSVFSSWGCSPRPHPSPIGKITIIITTIFSPSLGLLGFGPSWSTCHLSCPPPPPGGSLGYCRCAQEAISTMRRKKMGLSKMSCVTFCHKRVQHNADLWIGHPQGSSSSAAVGYCVSSPAGPSEPLL